jgi:isopenicillin-N N-acyltransferase like protein
VTTFARRHRKKLLAAGLVLIAPLLAHAVVGRVTRIEPPAVDVPRLEITASDDVRSAGRGWTTVRGVRVVHLAGSPEEIGAQHATLLGERMIENEGILWDGFRELVPFAPARALLFDMGRVRYRDVHRGFPDERRRELAAQAKTFSPDPYEGHLPTYQRMVMLHALYDISLGFERSPLLGCTAFGFGPEATADGHALFARAFDFEAADVFDRDKAVFVVREEGKIPFASVAWPGFVGVVTGMNAEGVALAVNGARAREPASVGMPVAFSLRETLASARSTDDAVRILSKHEVMVSHLVFVGDASGRFVVVERAPGEPAHARDAEVAPARAALTNHFEGPLAGDPKDDAVRATTTTLARRARADELLLGLPPKSATVASAVDVLRDHGCAGDAACPLGDRRAIDAFIATHGVVADLTARALWVSAGPHLSGKFVKIDVADLVSRGDAPPPPTEQQAIAEDPVLHDGRYGEARARAGGPIFGGEAR